MFPVLYSISVIFLCFPYCGKLTTLSYRLCCNSRGVNNQYDVTIYCDVKVDWCSVLVPLVFVIRSSQTGSRSSPLSLVRSFLMWIASRTFLGKSLCSFWRTFTVSQSDLCMTTGNSSYEHISWIQQILRLQKRQLEFGLWFIVTNTIWQYTFPYIVHSWYETRAVTVDYFRQWNVGCIFLALPWLRGILQHHF